MDTVSLKEYIFENQKIEHILEEIGCHHINYHQNKEFYSCGNYNGDNTGAINVKNNKYLNVTNWTRVKEFGEGSDIIDLVQYNKQLSFVNAVKYLHEILGLEYTPYKKPDKTNDDEAKFDPLAIFKDAIKMSRKVDVGEIHTLDEDLVNDYVPMLHIDWFKEGVMPWTKERFGLAYSYKYKRVIIPLRLWLDGSLLGFNQRTVVDNYKELGITKYYITPSYQKSLNLYGLHENMEEIESKKTCVIVESEKSVLKRHSRNDGTCVALSGHTLSEEQRRIILGLDITEVVIALDKDVPIEEVRFLCSKFYGLRKVSYIFDKWDLLGEKDAPADAPNKIYNFLFKYRVVYDESEHKKCVDSMKK